MEPKSAKNRKKIDAKIDRKIDASWGRFLERFWWIFGAKMEPSWHQNGIKNRCQLRKAFFSRNALSLQRGLVLQDQEGRKWEQKWTKNRAKNRVKKGRHLGIEFSSILIDLGEQNEGKIHQKSIQKGIGNLCPPSWPHVGASWTAPGPSWPHRPPLAGGAPARSGAMRRDAAAIRRRRGPS